MGERKRERDRVRETENLKQSYALPTKPFRHPLALVSIRRTDWE